MTVPGGDSGEKARDEGTPPSAEQPWAQPGREAPPAPSEFEPSPSGFEPPPSGFEPPPTSSTSGYPPPAYPPPGYPSAYPPPSGYPPPGYQEPSGYGGSSYPPGPPDYGSPYPPSYGQPYPGGYPPPDYQGGYGQPRQSGTNMLAIASLISSFVGLLCGIGSIVGIVLGAVALNQIKQTRQEGYGLAVAGIVVGVATLLVSLIVTIYALR
jgi:hypothetical protein